MSIINEPSQIIINFIGCLIRSHANYNSSEVGRRLALTMLNKLDPTAEPWADQTQNADSDLLPSYRQHKAVAVQLPGMLFTFSFSLRHSRTCYRWLPLHAST